MTIYAYPETKTKKALKEGVKEGKEFICREETPWGSKMLQSGTYAVSGPHYPKPHRWYASVKIENGIITEVK